MSIIEKLKNINPRFEESQNDDNIIRKCIDGVYSEEDFIYACKKLFQTTRANSIKRFIRKDVFIHYRNMHRDKFPDWLKDLSYDDQLALKDTYRELVSSCFLDHSYHTCNYPDILDLIQSYHREGIPYWCILGNIKRNFDCYKPIKKHQLIEFMNNGAKFKENCRMLFKKIQEFKKRNPKLVNEIVR